MDDLQHTTTSFICKGQNLLVLEARSSRQGPQLEPAHQTDIGYLLSLLALSFKAPSRYSPLNCSRLVPVGCTWIFSPLHVPSCYLPPVLSVAPHPHLAPGGHSVLSSSMDPFLLSFLSEFALYARSPPLGTFLERTLTVAICRHAPGSFWLLGWRRVLG